MKVRMTNAQFAIWIVQQEPSQMQNEIAEKVYKWLESKEVSPQETPVIENPILYAKLEHMIMEWSNDETKTAGELTRRILKLIK